MHSDMTRETGSTATETGRLRYCMRDEAIGIRLGSGVLGAEDSAESMAAAESWASRLILQPTGVRRVRTASLERVPL